ncbi:MAG TPA: trypsin-like peptidase domain-containing protein [Candidatus Saccharimonadales bacterium]|jgi:serine protease Do|nr:trypsin-like peptidase domain-containing protein [Candidatus Saccharimonadales bacterium]
MSPLSFLLRGLKVAAIAAFVAPLPSIAAQERGDNTLRKLNESVDALIKKVSPSVVQILVTGYGPIESGDRSNTAVVIGRQRAIGSGFVIDPEGYIITNAHVVTGAQRVQVVVPEGMSDVSSLQAILSARTNIVPARVVGVAKDIDLALLKVDNVKLNALSLAMYRNIRQGEVVLAFGSPEGLRNTVTFGVVSSVARQIDPDSPMVYIQTDAPINPGNSGGPLVNVDGDVVGINTFILSQSGGNEGLGFAIPSSVVNVAYQQLRKFGHIHHTQIGVGLQTISPVLAAALNLPRSYGVIVSDVLPGSPAMAAGVRIGDVLLTIEGRIADSVPFVSFRLMSVSVGAKVHLEVLRNKERLAFDIPVVEPPHEMDQIASLADPEKNLVRPLGFIGLEVDQKIAAMAPDLRDPFGIIVVARSSEGSDIPLTAGDVIRSLNGQPMTTLERLRAALAALQSGAPVVLQVQRDQRLLFLAFTLDQL